LNGVAVGNTGVNYLETREGNPMFLVAMLYLVGVMVSAISCAYTTPGWHNGREMPSSSDPSAILVAGVLWPLLVVGAAHFAMSVVLHKLEVHRTVHTSVTA
jgi:hypothetical protein